MKTKRTVLILLALSLLTLAGCSSHQMAMKYQPTVDVATSASTAKVALDAVVDNRNTGANWLGAIRGGYGNPLKKIYTVRNTNDEVASVFEEGLRARGLLDESRSARFSMAVDLTKFDSSQMFRKEAHAHFSVTVNDAASGETVFRRNYRSDRSAGAAPGLLGSPGALGRFANLTLNESVDKALNDPDFLAALRGTAKPAVTTSSATSRMQELEKLKNANLISDNEYRLKRAELLADL